MVSRNARWRTDWNKRLRNRGNISRLFREHWMERTTAGAARKALEELLPGSSNAVIPVDVQMFARYIGIEQLIEAEMPDCDGALSVTLGGSYVATVKKGQSPARRRFTLAHEMGHLVVYRSIGRRAPDGDQLCGRAESADERDEESLCDTLAAELLMPRMQFLGTMYSIGVNASTISGIAHRYGVSLHA